MERTLRGEQGSKPSLHLNTGVCLPGGCVQLGGFQEHKDPALVDNQLPMVAPPWGSYLEGLGHKRPFQPPTSSESVNQCTNTNVISHPAGTSGRAHLVSYLQKNIWPLRLCSSWGLLPNQHSNSHPLRNAINLLLSTPADKSKQQIKFRPSWTTGNSKCWCLGASVVSEHCHRYFPSVKTWRDLSGTLMILVVPQSPVV